MSVATCFLGFDCKADNKTHTAQFFFVRALARSSSLFLFLHILPPSPPRLFPQTNKMEHDPHASHKVPLIIIDDDYDVREYRNTKLNWYELTNMETTGPSEPLSRNYVETKVIRDYNDAHRTKFHRKIPTDARIPKYPGDDRQAPRPCGNYATHCNEGDAYAYIEEQTSKQDPQRRLSCIMHRKDEGVLLCVECDGKYVVVLVVDELYIYMNHVLLIYDTNFSPRGSPDLFSMHGIDLARFIRLQCENYMRLFTFKTFPEETFRSMFSLAWPSSSSSWWCWRR